MTTQETPDHKNQDAPEPESVPETGSSEPELGVDAEPEQSARDYSKATMAEVSRRVEMVYDLLLSGAESRHILNFAQQQGWGVCRTQVYEYIKRAREAIDEQVKEHMEQAFSMEVSARNRQILRLEQAQKKAQAARARLRVRAEQIEDPEEKAKALADIDLLDSTHPVDAVCAHYLQVMMADRAKLVGAYAPEKHNIGLDEGPLAEMTDEEIRRIAFGDVVTGTQTGETCEDAES